MANRRMLSKSISISEQANELSDFAALLFTWMIPHADDWGILPGSPKKVKALVIPMRKQTPKEVEKAIKEMVSNELIWWYEVEGEKYIQFCKWEKHQEGLHKRTNPKNPLYPGSSGNFPENPGQENLTEENLTEQKRREKDISPAPQKIKFAEFVTMTEEEHQKLVDQFGEEKTKDMIERLNLYKGSKGKKYKSDYMTILNWDRKDTEKGGQARAVSAGPGNRSAFQTDVEQEAANGYFASQLLKNKDPTKMPEVR
jgi:hypothetical protein